MLVVRGRSVLTLLSNASSRLTAVRIFSEPLRRIGLPFDQVSRPSELRAMVLALIMVSAVRYLHIPWPCSPQRKHSYGPLTVRELDVDALARGIASPMCSGLGKKARSVWCLRDNLIVKRRISWAIHIEAS